MTSVEPVDVCVVGAGVSGLTAATVLSEHAKTVLVLEARGRVGGRAMSTPTDGGVVDLGATWCWPTDHRVLALLDRLALRTFDQYAAGDAVYDAASGGRRLDGNPLHGASIRFSDGAQSLAVRMAERLPPAALALNWIVRAVEDAGSTLRVVGGHSAVEARHVILAAPPAVLVRSLRFRPELPAAVTALASRTPVWMGNTVKVVVCYDEPFWRADGLAGAAISHLGPLREIHDHSGENGHPAALFGFASSDSTDGLSMLAARQLARVFGARAAQPRSVHVVDWGRTPFSSGDDVRRLGAYQLYGHRFYAEPGLDGRLHWAGSETAGDAPGRLEGAIASGRRAATAVLQVDDHQVV
jgi:monoamine oxidase